MEPIDRSTKSVKTRLFVEHALKRIERTIIMKKRLLSAVMASAMVLSLAACGGAKTETTAAETSAESKEETTAADTTAAEETEDSRRHTDRWFRPGFPANGIRWR